jgi:predicted RecA/RadA family phage recombinase
MPYNRPGPGVYVVNGGTAINHGAPVQQNGFVGVAVKQQLVPWDQGLSVQAVIQPSEPYFIITKGVVQVPNAGITANVKGDPIYIGAGNVLTATTGSPKFGRVVEVAGSRGVPPNKVRIDLDSKDSFV